MATICCILFSLEKLCLFLHVVRRRQAIRSELESDVTSKEGKTGQNDVSIKTYFHYNLVSIKFSRLNAYLLIKVLTFVDLSSDHILSRQSFS
jgi:hypothetical protein